MARSGAIICKKSQLKNFCDLKTAGGCGVVPFWSVERIFSLFHDCCISKRMCRYQAVSNRESWSLNAKLRL
ncbi:hypothetical protein CHN42_03845 [Klebsiella pneumoniae]|nr:hypothetical protein [Klebsiella pneumoniae]QBN11287.1 hypothetical protein E2E36_15285 [Enterobacter cloacae complex sp.]HBW8377757.1 hypothetical protein [Klebsiella pneumoniae]HBX3447489.1 hypothetical protein [Klebsiella pneumoniae]